MSLFKDEQGKTSSARVAMWVVLVAMLYLAVRGLDRAEIVWKSMTDILLALISWAGGARGLQYISKLRSSTSPGPVPVNTGITPGDPL